MPNVCPISKATTQSSARAPDAMKNALVKYTANFQHQGRILTTVEIQSVLFTCVETLSTTYSEVACSTALS